jgi:hypothetical protein
MMPSIADLCVGTFKPCAPVQPTRRVMLMPMDVEPMVDEPTAEKKDVKVVRAKSQRPSFYASRLGKPTMPQRVRDLLAAHPATSFTAMEILEKVQAKRFSNAMHALYRLQRAGVAKRVLVQTDGYNLGRPAMRWQWGNGDK